MELHRCPTCRRILNERDITLFEGLVVALWHVWRWCEARGQFTFQRREVKHLFKTETETAHFGNWIYFGGIITRHLVDGRPRKGWYAFDVAKTRSFFSGNLKIPTIVTKDPVTKSLTPREYKTVTEIPSIEEFLNADNDWVLQYRNMPAPKIVEQGELFG